MPELLIITALFVVVAAAMWLFVAGDREQDFTDEDVRFTTSFEEEE